jgi:hypothetical protein
MISFGAKCSMNITIISWKSDLDVSAFPEIFPSANNVMSIVIVLNHLFAYWLLGNLQCWATNHKLPLLRRNQSNDWSVAGTSQSQHALDLHSKMPHL